MGFIIAVDPEDHSLTVRFDEDREVTYESGDLEDLEQAYCLSVHKSQGSEFPVVVMPVVTSHYVMLQRNLIYTGVTRAKRGMVLVGTRKALGYAVRNVSVRKRNTLLRQRLKGD